MLPVGAMSGRAASVYERLHSHDEFACFAALLDAPRYSSMESWTRLQQLEQVLLLELLRDSGGLPEWAAEPGRVPFISGSAVQAILKTKVTTAQWLLHGEEEPLFRRVGSGPRGVRVEQAGRMRHIHEAEYEVEVKVRSRLLKCMQHKACLK